MTRTPALIFLAAGPAAADTSQAELARIFARREFWWKHPAPAAEPPAWLSALADGWRRWWQPHAPTSVHGPSVGALAQVAEIVMWMLWLAGLLAAGWYTWRRWRAAADPAASTSKSPDLDEDPEVLPGWQALERQALEAYGRGDARRAVRGLYLAVLSALEENGHLTWDRGTTNSEYLHQVQRQAGPFQAFGTVTRGFDRTWYGWHAPSTGEFDTFRDQCKDLLK